MDIDSTADGQLDAGEVEAGNLIAPSRYVRDLARCWLIANLAAVAAIGAAFWQTAPAAPLIGWSVFVLLNTLLYTGHRSAATVGWPVTDNRLFHAGVAAVLGLAWGAGSMLFMPLAAGGQLGALGAATFGLAVIAIPVLGESRGAYVYFLVGLTTLALAGVLLDGRFVTATLWIALGAATLLVIAASYARALDHLRDIVCRFLALTERRYADGAWQPLPDAAFAGLAERTLGTLTATLATHERRRRVLHALGDGLVTTDDQGAVEFVNPVAELLLGGTGAELRGRPLADCLRLVAPPDQRNRARDIFEQSRLTRRTQTGGDNVQLIRGDGVVHGIDYVATPIKDEAGAFAGTSIVLRDVTEKRQRAETVAWRATHDPLTSAINRSEFELRLKKLARRGPDDLGNAHTLLYIDIDKFKFINDTYGHAAGDATLKAMADVVRAGIRGADTLARVGGDEFTALLYSCSGEQARLIADGLRAAVEQHAFKWQSIELPVSISVGVAEIDPAAKNIAEIIRTADSACYAAKRAGRNRVQVFERDQPLGQVQAQARAFDFVKDIQAALQGNRLELFYQPLCSMLPAQASDLCEISVGVRNARGDFIPRAELAEMTQRYQLAEDIDRWLLNAAIEALRLDHPALCDMELVLVPLSAQALGDQRWRDEIVATARQHRPQASRLGFIFEQPAVRGQLDHARHFISQLQAFDCRFMLRDLGFGGEAIALLKSLHMDYLGIGASLVQNMLHSSVDYEVVLGLCRAAQALGMRTVAEHVDHKSLRDALANMGVDYATGLVNDGPRRVAQYSAAQFV